MTDCDCMDCPLCDGHGAFEREGKAGDEATLICNYCSGSGVDPEFMGCDC